MKKVLLALLLIASVSACTMQAGTESGGGTSNETEKPSGDSSSAIFTQELKDHYLRCIEIYWQDRKGVDVEKWIERQAEDGSWTDVSYVDKNTTSAWDLDEHGKRLRDLALNWHYTGREDVLEAAKKAIRYWATSVPSNGWYRDDLYVPKSFGPSFLLLKDVLSEEEMAMAIGIMKKAYNTTGKTGFNQIALAGNRLMYGLLIEDDQTIKNACKEIEEVIFIAQNSEEGIQPDMSFHQHEDAGGVGDMFMYGSYGLEYAKIASWWLMALEGTVFELSQEKHDIVYNFVQDGLRWVVWNGYYDFSALGRHIQTNTQTSRPKLLDVAIERLGITEDEPKGCKYFPYSDFGVYRVGNWYGSIRMQSNRIKGFEYISNMNKKGYFSSDGAVLIRRDGDEYFNIPPLWDWHHIPGATTYDDGKVLNMKHAVFPFNKTDLVFGKTQNDILVAAMELNRDGLTAKKAYFFFPDGVVCLGAGITNSIGHEIITTLDQCLCKGEHYADAKIAHHNGYTYISLDENPLTVISESRSGCWQEIQTNESPKTVTGEVFEVHINHGTYPQNASYAYAIVPTGISKAEAESLIDSKVEIIANTTELQQVRIDGRNLTIDWSGNGNIEIE